MHFAFEYWSVAGAGFVSSNNSLYIVNIFRIYDVFEIFLQIYLALILRNILAWFLIKNSNKSEVIIALIEIDIYSVFFEIYIYFKGKRQN